MSALPQVRRAEPTDAAAIARLHEEQIAEGFLSVLGRRFLARLYRRVTAAPASFAFVSTDGRGSVTGFVAVAESTRRLYKDFLVRDGLVAAAGALPTVVRHLPRVIETLRHGFRDVGAPAGAEILALAVAPAARGQGLGLALVNAATHELQRRGVTSAHVVTAHDNEAAQRAYRAGGFRPATTIAVHQGTEQDVLVWG